MSDFDLQAFIDALRKSNPQFMDTGGDVMSGVTRLFDPGGFFRTGQADDFQAKAPTIGFKQQMGDYNGQAMQAWGNAQAGNDQANASAGQQQAFIQQLQDQAAGKGPSLAQNQLNAAREGNIAASQSAAASARGLNPVMRARLAEQGMNSANAGAAAQSGQTRLQEQLGAQSMLGSALSGMRGQDISQMGANAGMYGQAASGLQGENALGLQQATGNAQLNMQAQDINAKVAQENAQAQQKKDAGVIGMVGGVLGSLAEGGEVDDAAPALGGSAIGDSEPDNGLMEEGGGKDKKGEAADRIGKIVKIIAMLASKGGEVPGKAEVPGNSILNDKVPVIASPGEVMLPRTVAHDPDRAYGFIQALNAQRKTADMRFMEYLSTQQQTDRHMAEGGDVDSGSSADATLKDLDPGLWDYASSPRAPSKADADLPWLTDPENPGETKLSRFLGLTPPGADSAAGAAPKSDLAEGEKTLSQLDPGVDELSKLPAAPAPAPQAAPVQAQLAPVAPRAAGGGQARPDEMALGEQEQIAGVRSAADVAQREANANTAAMMSAEQQRISAKQDFDKRMAAQQQRSDAIFKDIMSSKVDPNRWWNSKPTAGKIGAAIAAGMGGYLSGMNGGPNYILENMQKAITNDIESQKTDLGKKETLLGHYMQQGRDMQEARSLASADMKDAAAAQLARVSAQYGGDKAGAAAQSQIGAIRMSASKDRQEAELRRMSLAQSGQQMELQRRSMDIQARQMGAIEKLASGQGGSGANTEYLPPEVRERVVVLPNGQKALARDKGDAAAVNTAVGATNRFQTALDKIEAFRKTHSGGKMLPDSEADQGKELRQEAIAALSELYDTKLSGLSTQEQELFKARIPDPQEFLTTDSKVSAKIASLKSLAQTRISESIRQHVQGRESAKAFTGGER